MLRVCTDAGVTARCVAQESNDARRDGTHGGTVNDNEKVDWDYFTHMLGQTDTPSKRRALLRVAFKLNLLTRSQLNLAEKRLSRIDTQRAEGGV